MSILIRHKNRSSYEFLKMEMLFWRGYSKKTSAFFLEFKTPLPHCIRFPIDHLNDLHGGASIRLKCVDGVAAWTAIGLSGVTKMVRWFYKIRF